MTRAQLITEITAKILSGGRRTTAENVRDLVTDFVNSTANIDNDRNQPGGYMGINASGDATANDFIGNLRSDLSYLRVGNYGYGGIKIYVGVKDVIVIDASGVINFPLLAGTGTRMIVANSSGDVSTETIKIISGRLTQVVVATTAFTVAIGSTLAANNYSVCVTPTGALSAALFYVTNKTTTTFDVVYLAGLTGTVTFDWILSIN